MIEPTDEMVQAWREGMNDAAAKAVKRGANLFETGDIARAGLAAVFALVERDYTIRPRRARCTKCGSFLQKCDQAACLNRAECGVPWCAEHVPDGTW